MEASEVLKALGYDLGDKKPEDIKVEDIKTWHSDNFVGINIAHDNQKIRDKVIGSVKGGLETKIKRGFKELDIEFENSDNLLDAMIEGDESGFKKIKATIEQIKEEAKGSNDEKVTKLQSKLDTLTNDFSSIKTIKSQLEKEKKELEKSLSNAENNFKIKSLEDKYLDSSWISEDFIADKDIRDTAIDGFHGKFRTKYKWELDDSEESPDGFKTVYADGENKGSRVTIDNKFASLSDIFKAELKAKKMLKQDSPERKKNVFDFNDKDKNVPLPKSHGHKERLEAETNSHVS